VDRTVAAVDIGTNSFHLLVARVDPEGGFEILDREKETVRLGSGGGDMKALAPDAIDRGVAALIRFAQIASRWDAEITAVATSAVREATNRQILLDRARAEAGIEIEVISGTEEARLIHLGALQAVPMYDRRHLVVDIGGGSTEFIVGEGSTPLLLRSQKLGAIRLTDRFFPGGVTRRKKVAECRRHISAFISPLVRDVRALGFEVAVASSGTAQTLAQLIAARRGEQPRSVANLTFTAAELEDVTDLITGLKTPDDRLSALDLEPRRADIIAAGAVLLDQITTDLHISEWRISEYALRTGILVDQARRHHGDDTLHRLSDIRRRSVEALARRSGEDLHHAEHLTDLALELFDATAGWHGLDETDRDLLEAAGLLHNIGTFVSHSAHHRHSYYIIRNSEHLTGFTEHERELVAQIARYHRKSAPKAKHPEWAALRRADRERVRVMAGILRVAIGLDRTNRAVVKRLDVTVSPRGIDIAAVTEVGADASLELYTADQRSGLLAESLGLEVHLTQVEDPGVGRGSHPALGLTGEPGHESLVQ